jgi:hypothetical protein
MHTIEKLKAPTWSVLIFGAATYTAIVFAYVFETFDTIVHANERYENLRDDLQEIKQTQRELRDLLIEDLKERTPSGK